MHTCFARFGRACLREMPSPDNEGLKLGEEFFAKRPEPM